MKLNKTLQAYKDANGCGTVYGQKEKDRISNFKAVERVDEESDYLIFVLTDGTEIGVFYKDFD